MKLFFSHELNCPAQNAWEKLQSFQHLKKTSTPFLQMDSPTPIHSWQLDQAYSFKLKLFGWIPWGNHHVRFLTIDPIKFYSESQEFGPRIQHWWHKINIKPLGNSQCRIEEELHIQAGWHTLLVVSLAYFLYRHRRTKWQRWLKVEPLNIDKR